MLVASGLVVVVVMSSSIVIAINVIVAVAGKVVVVDAELWVVATLFCRDQVARCMDISGPGDFPAGIAGKNFSADSSKIDWSTLSMLVV